VCAVSISRGDGAQIGAGGCGEARAGSIGSVPRLANTYWLVCPSATSDVPKVAAFRDWLLAEAAEDARRLKQGPGDKKKA
jgi:hypothetical protein